jgi:hypothetical protein
MAHLEIFPDSHFLACDDLLGGGMIVLKRSIVYKALPISILGHLFFDIDEVTAARDECTVQFGITLTSLESNQ